MLPNLDFHHPTTWMVWLRTALSHTITSSITTGNYYRVKLKLCSIATNLSENFLIFRWDFFAGRPKNNHVLWVMIKMSLKQTRGGGLFILMKGKVRFQRFWFCVRLLFHHFESFKVPRLNSFPMFSKLFKRESQKKLEDGCVPNQSESQNDSKLVFFHHGLRWVAHHCWLPH